MPRYVVPQITQTATQAIHARRYVARVGTGAASRRPRLEERAIQPPVHGRESSRRIVLVQMPLHLVEFGIQIIDGGQHIGFDGHRHHR